MNLQLKLEDGSAISTRKKIDKPWTFIDEFIIE